MTLKETDRLIEEPIRWTITSSRPYDQIAERFGIPKEVRGIRILDLGAGGSSFVPTLLEKGADAYAVDHIYSEGDSQILAKLELNIIAGIRNKGESWRPDATIQKKAYEHFFKSKRMFPNRYKTAEATNLPFPDNYFDYVVSNRCIVPYLDRHLPTLLATKDELIRVAKERGIIQISPIFEPQDPTKNIDSKTTQRINEVYKGRQENQQTLLRILENDPLVTIQTEEAKDGIKTLVLIKNLQSEVNFRQFKQHLEQRGYGAYD